MNKIKKKISCLMVAANITGLSFCGEQPDLNERFSDHGVDQQTYVWVKLEATNLGELESVAFTVAPREKLAAVLKDLEDLTKIPVEKQIFTYTDGKEVPPADLVKALIASRYNNNLVLHQQQPQ